MDQPVTTENPQSVPPAPSSTKCRRCTSDANLNKDGLCGVCQSLKDLVIARKAGVAKRKAEVRAKFFDEVIGEASKTKYSFENFRAYDEHTAKALDIAQAFNHKTDSLFFFGTTGGGKTHLTLAITIRAFEQDLDVAFFRSGKDLGRHLRGLEGAEEAKRIDAISRADLFVVNEIGLGQDGKETDFVIGCLVEILDARATRGKEGFIGNSNFHPSDLNFRLNSRLIGLCTIIEGGKDDYRKMHRQI